MFAWDCHLNNSGQLKTWSSEIKSILSENHLGHLYEQQQIFSVPEIVSKLKISMFKKQKVNLKNECETKPKLRTFVTFKNFETLPPHVGKPLSFFERKILSKLRLGILPIRLETGRYLRPVLPEAQRLCYCNSGEVESESHVLFICQKYDRLREAWLYKLQKPDNYHQLCTQEKFKLVLNEPKI